VLPVRIRTGYSRSPSRSQGTCSPSSGRSSLLSRLPGEYIFSRAGQGRRRRWGGGEQEEEELPLTSVTETTSHHGSRSSSPLRGGHIPAEARPGGASSPDPRTPPPCPATARPRLRAPARVNKAGWCAGEAQTSLGLGSGPPEPGISLMARGGGGGARDKPRPKIQER
jgi:hypothetical protein